MVDWPGPDELTRALVDGPSGCLEYLIETPKGTSRGVVLICHPHPQFGGTMDNKVVYSLARSAITAGWTAVRFNYRGVGKSEGRYDEGRGEVEDAASVLLSALSRQPGRIVLAGFSFGAAVALRLSKRLSIAGLVSIAPPLGYFENETLPEPDCPWLVIHGDEDEVISFDETMNTLSTLKKKPEIEVISGAGHFFHGRLTELRNLVTPFLDLN